MDFLLREAIDSDIPLIKEYSEKFHLDSEDIFPHNFYVVEKDGQLAGFGRCKEYGKIYEISTIGVIEEFRRQGAGKMLVNRLILSGLKREDWKEIWLTTVIPEYFTQFGFRVCSNAPEELILKGKRICKKFNKKPDMNVYMKLCE